MSGRSVAPPRSSRARQPRTGRTFATEILELADGHGGGVDVGQQEVLGGAERERLDDPDGEEAVGQRTERVGERVVKLGGTGACLVQVRHPSSTVGLANSADRKCNLDVVVGEAGFVPPIS